MKDRAYEIARNPSCDGYHQRVLASMVYTFFNKKTGSRASVNEEIAEKSRRQIIQKKKSLCEAYG